MTAAMCRADLQRFPDPGTDRVVLVDPVDGRQFRLTAEALRVLDLLDGARRSVDIATVLGVDRAAAPAIEHAINRLLAIGLAVDLDSQTLQARGGVAARTLRSVQNAWQRLQRPGRRLRYSPPATVEFSLGNPRRMLNRLARLSAPLAAPVAQMLVAAVSVVGLLTFVLRWPARRELLAQPTSLPVLLAALALTLLTTALHELAHGVVLHRHGGNVRRMGAMLMYGSPALFCDVSQAWRLSRRKRVTVALAGVRVHLFAAGLFALLLAVLPLGHEASQLLCFVALADLSMAVVNLIPFVKFDGYIALVGWTDIPHLRQKSMALLRGAVALAVFGGRSRTGRDGGPAGPGWTLFGAACAVTGPILGMWAVISYGPLLAATTGPVGAVVVVSAAVVLLYLPLRGLLRAAELAASRGASRVRRLSGALVATTLIGISLAAIPLPLNTSAPWARTAEGLYLEVNSAASPAVGTTVRLTRSGIVFAEVVGTATVCGPATHHQLPITAGSPLVGQTMATVDRLAVPLCPVPDGFAGPATPTYDGMASTQGASGSVADWLRAVLFTPYLRVIFPK